MAYSASFLHQSAFASSATRSSSSTSLRHMSLSRPVHFVCRAQQQSQEDDNSSISRRLALTFLVGAASVGFKLSPAEAAYGEAGTYVARVLMFKLQNTNVRHHFNRTRAH